MASKTLEFIKKRLDFVIDLIRGLLGVTIMGIIAFAVATSIIFTFTIVLILLVICIPISLFFEIIDQQKVKKNGT